QVDLDIWSDLAAETRGQVLDLGCGIGRVSHHLNRLGHITTGVDQDPNLIDDFNQTRPSDAPAALTADVTALLHPDSPIRDRTFNLVIAPQQLLQILGSPEARMTLLQSLAHLTVDQALLAFAICEELPEAPIDYPNVSPDLREIDGWVHSSQPISIETGLTEVTAIRRRTSLSPNGQVSKSLDSVTLERLSRSTLEGELAEAGLHPVRAASIPVTDRHMGSTLVVARAFSP
ncbi:MAG: methyltransferase domain-containing protein, partial [Solirubrobacterales bacterium]